ncbi:MAG: ABC transporter ATP-binding protein [Verrucomicrobia bacterium]|nr:ABC transporter ATP-binding protein [Verrucomicrobiota bacterium]
MIEVNSLTKQYAGRTAVDGLTFSVEAGQCVGFLGPNGAGKSTTMRILAGYLSPTSGTARVNGFDVFHESIKARQSIGYMPENAPLYLDMRVNEYLHFRGALKGLRGRELRKRGDDVMEACGLTASKRKIIATLSKGFRQRVALADALISRPPLLILDEPSNGLDPLQMRHIRELLAELRPEQTILLSTHLLGEVEQSCDRVLLIHRGQICADDSPRNLVRKLRAATDVKLELQGQGPFDEELAKISGVRKITERKADGDWKRFTLRVEARADVRAAIFEVALQKQWHIRELHRELPSLEDVFVELTEGK